MAFFKIITLLLLQLCASFCFGQQTTTDSIFTRGKTFAEILNNADVVLNDVKQKPRFPGGKEEWKKYLVNTIDVLVPARKKAPNGTYYVGILFIISKDGALRNVRAESGCGYGMEDEVIRSIKASPKWQPAQTSLNEFASFATRQLVVFNIKGTSINIRIP